MLCDNLLIQINYDKTPTETTLSSSENLEAVEQLLHL